MYDKNRRNRREEYSEENNNPETGTNASVGGTTGASTVSSTTLNGAPGAKDGMVVSIMDQLFVVPGQGTFPGIKLPTAHPLPVAKLGEPSYDAKMLEARNTGKHLENKIRSLQLLFTYAHDTVAQAGSLDAQMTPIPLDGSVSLTYDKQFTDVSRRSMIDVINALSLSSANNLNIVKYVMAAGTKPETAGES